MSRQEALRVAVATEPKSHAPTFTGPHTPETRAKIAAAIRLKWQDPDYRDPLMASRVAAEQRPEVREKRRAAVLARWSDPQQKEEQSARLAVLWQDPDFRLTVMTAKLLGRVPSEENTFAPGVRPESISFLTLAGSNGSWKALAESDQGAANLIELYFKTEATINELAATFHLSPFIVRRIIQEGITFLWQKLPPELQEQFPIEKVLRFKITQTPKTKEKLRKTAKLRLAQESFAQDEENNGDQ